jgi:1-acyl-sn-glycerol-3-phosphate acyltransferase
MSSAEAVVGVMSGGSGGRTLYRVLHLGPLERWIRRLALLAAFGVWPRVLGRRHVPRGPLVVTGTHVNRLDVPLFLMATGRHIEWVAAGYFLALPVYGRVARWGGWHPIEEAGLGLEENAETMDRAAAAVRGGAAVCIFAQGFTAKFGTGVARLAAASGAPVLPVLSYRPRMPPARPRILVVVHRPLPPPAPDARSRRRFVERLRRRMHALGALRYEGVAAAIRGVALDDPALWRNPLAVIRRAARLARAKEPEPLGRRARFLQRACARLSCSVGDLRAPAGLAHLVALLLLLPPALAGLALVAPPVVALFLVFRGHPRVDFRTSLLRLTATFAAPWALVLASAGCLAAGAWGLALPPVAVAGSCCAGVARRLLRQLRGSVAARRHGHRLRGRLAEFDRLVAEAGG